MNPLLIESLVAPHIDDLRRSGGRSARSHLRAAEHGVASAVHLIGRRYRRAVAMSQLSDPVGGVDRG
jgi:hypothetical protein